MGDDLHRARLQWVRRELDQIGTAMSVVGTSRPMLQKMGRYLEPSIQGLRGDRPEIRRVREDLVRAQHNLSRGPTTPARASRNMRIARDLMDKVLKLQSKGLLDLPAEYEEGRVTLENVWGYKPQEVKSFRALWRQAVSDLADVGLYGDLVYGVVLLDEDEAGGRFLTRDDQTDQFVADPSRGRSKADIFDAFGGRVWDKLFMPSDRQTWGTRGRFITAFTKAMRGSRLDSDDRARLTVTVGRIAGGDWPGMAA